MNSPCSSNWHETLYVHKIANSIFVYGRIFNSYFTFLPLDDRMVFIYRLATLVTNRMKHQK